MTSYQTAHRWFQCLPTNAYAGGMLFAMLMVAATVFGVFPHGSGVFFNAALSGGTWAICLGILILGGKRVDLYDTTTAALIAAGLTTSIPTLFADDSTVAWGSTFSRLGVLMMAARFAYNIHERVHGERMREREGE